MPAGQSGEAVYRHFGAPDTVVPDVVMQDLAHCGRTASADQHVKCMPECEGLEALSWRDLRRRGRERMTDVGIEAQGGI